MREISNGNPSFLLIKKVNNQKRQSNQVFFLPKFGAKVKEFCVCTAAVDIINKAQNKEEERKRLQKPSQIPLFEKQHKIIEKNKKLIFTTFEKKKKKDLKMAKKALLQKDNKNCFYEGAQHEQFPK